MRKIKTGDEVIILAGKDKGERGRVLSLVNKKRKDYVIVEGLNIVRKHVRPNPQANQTGGIIDREAPLHISNVALFNEATGKASRVGFKRLNDGRKVRVYKDNDEVVDA